MLDVVLQVHDITKHRKDSPFNRNHLPFLKDIDKEASKNYKVTEIMEVRGNN